MGPESQLPLRPAGEQARLLGVAAALPRGQLDVLRMVVGAQVQYRIYQLDPLHLQNFHI